MTRLRPTGPGDVVLFEGRSETRMNVAVQFTRREEERALPILLRHSPGMALRDRVYILSEDIVDALRDAGVRFTVVASASTELTSEPNAPLDQAYDTRLLAGFRAAVRKARELGYHVERMHVRAAFAQGIWSVHFAPVQRPGSAATGADLSVTVDANTGQVVQIRRGQ